jgi:hypothetical protein
MKGACFLLLILLAIFDQAFISCARDVNECDRDVIFLNGTSIIKDENDNTIGEIIGQAAVYANERGEISKIKLVLFNSKPTFFGIRSSYSISAIIHEENQISGGHKFVITDNFYGKQSILRLNNIYIVLPELSAIQKFDDLYERGPCVSILAIPKEKLKLSEKHGISLLVFSDYFCYSNVKGMYSAHKFFIEFN